MDRTMEAAAERTSAPWHLWVVGVLSLLWNGFGAYDYLMSKLQNREYLEGAFAPAGVSVDAGIAYMDAMPLWANLAWGFGVWGAVAGSILLLLRSRYAMHAFVVSLAGLVLGAIRQTTSPMPGMTDSAVPMAFTAVITIFTLLLIWYARRQTATGVLR